MNGRGNSSESHKVTEVTGPDRADDYPDLPECLRRTPPTTNGHRPPRGKGWHLVGDKPPGQAGVRVWLKERMPPALGPPGDDVFDIEPRWRQ